MNEINNVALESLRIRITKVLPAQIRACVDALDDDQIWWRQNEKSNSLGNLVLHVRGSVLHFLCHRIGGVEYERDRPKEFAIDGRVPKQQLLELFDEMVKEAVRTFEGLDPSILNGPSTEPAYYTTIFEDLFGIAVHLATHAGQVVYITKMLNEKALNELWSQTHKEHGAWRG